MSVDVDASDIDINQCDQLSVGENVSVWQMDTFLGTHKCHNQTSKCVFTPGYGWARGSYKCHCRDGFYSATGKPIFNGTLVESAFKDKMTLNSPTYDMLFVCKRCQPGCDFCEDDSPCLANYNWAFRISLLTITLICIFLTLILTYYVYRYRKLKVINVASPIFLCITLAGCIIMYSEMAAIFPVLSMYSCIATKWTRHMGFCLTYSALLLKTWRVSLTYRVKSAHKLKLTDKQLLQWLFPILLVMAIYLGTWTISSPPAAVYIKDWDQLKFKQCDYNWWDHSLAIGEFLFLLWGIRVCYNVRNAESVFNEAKHISWAVHSITIVNIIMVMIHLVILPNAGPDIKYLFGFVRTQLSTTITVILIFGPKFYRVIKGQGDVWDNRARARGVTASFSLNGVGPVYEEPQDLYQENEELKEEVQKLASQIEFMKIVHMEVNNRHLKPKHGGFFSQTTSNQSPVIKNIYMKFESTDSPGSRISPAAELVSEKV
ncbi:probable G-protein coupled receptor CG31760 [Uloborus diversus]|uniref:probable G-protein coupled receptor CG31760 n=1 Tax=Uloborus diversus TaxID=327109 RepID=UPI00240973DA|nr:probable G-protein coupled receptor CG31760 [Uloborus diversus]